MIVNLAKENNARLLPIDSEHNAIFQVFEESNRANISKLILTASGGPFLKWSKEGHKQSDRAKRGISSS